MAREPHRPRALLGAPVLEFVPHSSPPTHLGSDHELGFVVCKIWAQKWEKPMKAGFASDRRSTHAGDL